MSGELQVRAAVESASSQRVDVCPECGHDRVELVVVPGRFFCPRCGVAGPGPTRAADEQLALDV